MHFDLAQDVRVSGEVLQCLTVVAVRRSDLELFEVVQDVQLGQIDACVVVASVRVFNNDQIEPSASSLPTRCDADLMTLLLKLLTDLIELLSREWARADSGRVGFYYADDFFQRAPAKGEAGEDAAETGVRRGDERVCAVVNVKHESIGTFDENGSVFFFGGGEKRDGVDDVLFKLDTVFLRLGQSARFEKRVIP